ncbi:MAG: glutathione S-transferase family protein, partial [Burkholderiales bacterium]|nr:glutathione S-transferase family protein [Burkholderiales bacterium]
ALAESGLAYRVHRVTLASPPAERGADFLAATPYGRIPAIVDPDGPGGRITLSQSGAVMIYVANKAGRLWPDDHRERIAALQWFMYSCSDAAVWNAVMNQVALNILPDESGKLTDVVRGSRLLRWFREADLQLEKTEYLSGGTCALPDFALFPVVNQRRPWIEEAGLKHLTRWADAVGARPGVQMGIAQSS